MITIILSAWVYFSACGFSVQAMEEVGTTGVALMRPAPNIRGYWVRKTAIVGIVDWRMSRGIQCTSIYAQGTPHPVHVIGGTDEVLQKLR